MPSSVAVALSTHTSNNVKTRHTVIKHYGKDIQCATHNQEIKTTEHRMISGTYT